MVVNCGIYRIVCNGNSKIYIGSSKNIKRRFNMHRHLLNNNKHHSNYLQNSWNKYGKDNFVFETIEEVKDCSKLFKRELYYINRYNTVSPSGFNSVYPSERGGSGLYGKLNGMYGKTHSPEVRKRISECAKKRIGKLNPNYGNGQAISGSKNPFWNKKHTEETKRKISQTKTGQKYSDEFKEKCRKRMFGKKYSAKITRETVIEIKTMLKNNIPRRQVADKLNLCIKHIGMIARGTIWRDIK